MDPRDLDSFGHLKIADEKFPSRGPRALTPEPDTGSFDDDYHGHVPLDATTNYFPLEVGERQIRLLLIHPEDSSVDKKYIECELQTFTIDSSPPYVALSYTSSEDSQQVAPVLIDDKLRYFSATAVQALGFARRKDVPDYIWVDQICINSDDNLEKTAQVQLLPQIYRRSYYVLAWTGPAFQNSDALFGYFTDLIAKRNEADWQGIWELLPEEEDIEKIAVAFDIFCRSAYWRRLWVIQEVFYGSNVLVTCGSSWLSASDICLAMSTSDYIRVRSVVPAKVKWQEVVQRLDTVMPRSSRGIIQNVLERRCGQPKCSGEDTFFRALITTLVQDKDYIDFGTTDPRDRVLSLILLQTAKEHRKFRTLINYTKPCSYIYVAIAARFLGIDAQIDMLAYCQFPKSVPGLPTWVPDWSMELKTPCTQAPWKNGFSASGDTKFSAPNSYGQERSAILNLAGYKVDEITAFGDIWRPDWRRRPDKGAVIGFIDGIMRLCLKSARVKRGEELLEALRIATAGGARWTANRAQPIPATTKEDIVEDFTEYLEAYKGIQAEGSMNQSSDKIYLETGWWMVDAIHYLHNRRPFLTKTGLVGLGPANMNLYDEVCIFSGAKVPYVVRGPRDTAHFVDFEGELVGEAYVHGIMYGEWMRGNPIEKRYRLS